MKSTKNGYFFILARSMKAKKNGSPARNFCSQPTAIIAIFQQEIPQLRALL